MAIGRGLVRREHYVNQDSAAERNNGKAADTDSDSSEVGCIMTPLVASIFDDIFTGPAAVDETAFQGAGNWRADGGDERDVDADEYLTASCGGPNCASSQALSAGNQGPGIHLSERTAARNHRMERRACRQKERVAFKTPLCTANDALSTSNGFTFIKMSQLTRDGKKYLVRGCLLDLNSQKLDGSKLICCGQFHFDRLGVHVIVPSEDVFIGAFLDNLCFTRLFKMEASDFFDEHEFHCDEPASPMCRMKNELFQKLMNSKDLTILAHKDENQTVIVSAVIM